MINPEKSLKISSGTIVKGTGGSAVIKADSKYFGMELIRIEGDDISISSISFDGNNRVNRVVVIGGGSHRINISNSFVANAAHSSDPDSDYYRIDLSTYLPGYVQSNIMCSFNRIQAPKYTIQTAPSNQNVVIM
ncbi:hypothetical protein D3C74_397680 [compost metagenome]